MRRRPGTSSKGPTAIAARFTPSVSAPCPIPCCRPSTLPTARCPACAASRSNTPLQALTTLNEPLFVESAQALAARTLKEGGSTDRDRVAYAFRLCTARAPSPAEADVLLQLLAKEDRRLADGWLSAIDIAGLKTGRAALPLGRHNATPRQLAAWTVVARVLLNLDETITKE